MPYEFEVQQEQLTYTGYYSRPLFELWGNGGKIVGGIFDALQPYRVNLSDIHLEPGQANASDTVLTAKIAIGGACRFSFDRVELAFSSFTEESLKEIPTIINASTEWIRKAVPSVRFASHRSIYHAHGKLRGTTIEEFLKIIGPKNLKSAGIDRGSGAIYHYEVPSLTWTTQIILDRSLLVLDGLYLMLAVALTRDILSYEDLLVQGRLYLSEVLNELGLHFPELGG